MPSHVWVVARESDGHVLGTYVPFSNDSEGLTIAYRDETTGVCQRVPSERVVLRQVEIRLGRIPTRLALIGPGGTVR